ncbi:MAG: twin-arginine translocation signal domain-containing protein [Deltaproteobacteria bacterium]|nr:twin-arginine translocation signal domain-containing protein [Deltaproteobacteria bacterium]
MSDITRRSFLKAAGVLAVVAVTVPKTLLELFDEVAPPSDREQHTTSMWVKPKDPSAPLGADLYFQGEIAQVQIYNRALSVEEMQALYEHEKAFLGEGWQHVTKIYDGGVPKIVIG